MPNSLIVSLIVLYLAILMPLLIHGTVLMKMVIVTGLLFPKYLLLSAVG